MGDKIKTGGAAFPLALQDVLTANGYIGAGMTLRDWFAGMALANSCYCDGDAPHNAEWAYTQADAMIAEREREDKQ